MTEPRPSVEPIRPGALTELLRRLAATPEPSDGGWDPVLREGAVFGRYELVRELGRGGFGVVWEARDRTLHRPVAFKAVRPGARDAEQGSRLLEEAEAAARLSHPNIVTIFDVGEAEAGPYVVLELLRGETLGARLASTPLGVREAVAIARQVAAGLAHAHARGVVHRDLKPDNVFVCDDGRVKVLDFGMAQAFGKPKQEGGTSGYMAPEQRRGAPEDERTDVYALGVMLHRMLAGEPPFPAEDRRQAPPVPVLEVPGAPSLGPFLARMLAWDPVDRPRAGGEVLEALEAIERQVPGATPSEVAVRARPQANGFAAVVRRRRTVRALVIAATVAAVAAPVAYHFLWKRPATVAAARVRPLVAVADFANETRDPELDGLSGMLTTALEQSRWLSVLTRTRLLDLLKQAGKDKVERIDEGLGREASRRAGAALVLATVRRFDDLYVVDVKVLDTGRDEYLVTAKEEARGKAAVPGLIDRVSERVREGMREAPSDLSAPRVEMAAAVKSLEAYQHYQRALEVFWKGPEASVAEFRKALTIDPDFPLAHYGLSLALEFYGTWVDPAPGAQRREIEAALRGAGRLPEKERLLVEAWKAHVDERLVDAHALLAQAAERFPQDLQVLEQAANLYYYEPDVSRALPYYERLQALDPSRWWSSLAICFVHLGQSAEALALLDRFGPRSGEESGEWLTTASIRVAAGQGARAIADLRKECARPGPIATLCPAWVNHILLQARQFHEAEVDAGRSLDDPGIKTKDEYRYARRWLPEQLAIALVYQGKLEQAEQAFARGVSKPHFALARGDAAAAAAALEKAFSDTWTDRPHLRRAAPLLLEHLGFTERAGELAPRTPPCAARRAYEALAAFHARGDLSGLRAMVEEGSHTMMPFFLGEALLESGDAAGASTALRRFRDGPRGSLFGWLSWRNDLFDAYAYPKAHVLLARALEAQGDLVGAREAIDAFLDLWKDADPELPLLAEGKTIKARLERKKPPR